MALLRVRESLGHYALLNTKRSLPEHVGKFPRCDCRMHCAVLLSMLPSAIRGNRQEAGGGCKLLCSLHPAILVPALHDRTLPSLSALNPALTTCAHLQTTCGSTCIGQKASQARLACMQGNCVLAWG